MSGKRLVVVDVGALRTRAQAFDVGGGVCQLGTLEMESATLSGDVPALAPRQDLGGLRVAEPAVMRTEDGSIVVIGAPAATLGGLNALLAGKATEERVELLLMAAIFPFVSAGDEVEVLVVDSPSVVSDLARSVVAAWQHLEVTLTGFDARRGELVSRAVVLNGTLVPAGSALVEFAIDRNWLAEAGPPLLICDIGHRSSRVYLLSFDGGLLDLDVYHQGGRSLIEYARRYAEERSWQTGGDVSLIRQLAAGTDMLSFGGLSFVTKKFFALPLAELEKTLVAGIASRLSKHIERGGRWPHAMMMTGGGADVLTEGVYRRLANRKLAIERRLVPEAGAQPALLGAFVAHAAARA